MALKELQPALNPNNKLLRIAYATEMLSQMRLALTLVSLSVTIATIGLPIYTAQLNMSGIELGGLLSAGAFAAALSRPIIGRAVDRFGRKPFLLLGTALMVLAALVFAIAQNTLLLFLASTVHGLSLGTLMVAAYAMTSDLSTEEGRGSHFGLVEESQQRGGLVGLLIMAAVVLLMRYFNSGTTLIITAEVWALAFATYAVVAALAFFVIWSKIAETYRPLETTARATGRTSQQPKYRLNQQLVTLLAVVFLTSASVYASQPILLKYISETITSDLTWIALAFAPSAILVSVLPSRMGRFSDKYGRTLPILVGLGANAMYSLAVPFLGSMTALTIFATMESLCYSATVPAEQAMMADLTHNEQRGVGFGLYTLAQTSGKVLGYLAMGALYDIAKSSPFFLNAAVLGVCMLLVWLVLRKTDNPHINQSS